jgi:hypothetical protein
MSVSAAISKQRNEGTPSIADSVTNGRVADDQLAYSQSKRENEAILEAFVCEITAVKKHPHIRINTIGARDGAVAEIRHPDISVPVEENALDYIL